jgi:hypothetical protein
MAEDKERLFDLRTVERNIEKGLITRKEYQEHLESLGDQADNAGTMEAQFEEGVLEDDEEEEEEDGEE